MTGPAAFEVEIGEQGGVHVLCVRGELDLSTAPAFEQPLESVLDGAERPVVLVDLAECEFIDSTGIALIVRAWQRLDQCDGGGRLALCGAARQVKRILEISGVGTSIPLYPNAEAALASLDGGAAPA